MLKPKFRVPETAILGKVQLKVSINFSIKICKEKYLVHTLIKYREQFLNRTSPKYLAVWALSA